MRPSNSSVESLASRRRFCGRAPSSPPLAKLVAVCWAPGGSSAPAPLNPPRRAPSRTTAHPPPSPPPARHRASRPSTAPHPPPHAGGGPVRRPRRPPLRPRFDRPVCYDRVPRAPRRDVRCRCHHRRRRRGGDLLEGDAVESVEWAPLIALFRRASEVPAAPRWVLEHASHAVPPPTAAARVPRPRALVPLTPHALGRPLRPIRVHSPDAHYS